MADISAFTGKFRVPKQTQATTPTKVQRRPRESAVCKQCRASKLRCDRGRPACGNCVKKDAADQCNYDHSINRRTATQQQNIAEDRLAHLESLVKELIQNQSASNPGSEPMLPLMTPEDSPDKETIDRAGPGRNDQGDYVGFTHWSAILDELDGLKADLVHPDNVQDEEDNYASRPSMFKESIFGSPEIFSLQQITEDFLPQKVDADRLLSLHFQGENFILPFIHTLYFQRQYQQFWDDTAKVNPLWLSILFSIFHLASLARSKNVSFDQSDNESLGEDHLFHTAAGQCLVIGEYHRPQEFVVEALLLYAHCRSVAHLDPQRETGVIHSMAVRSAYQLGYHRDPDNFKTFTPFEGEMRRRTWAVCKQLDLMTSFQLGLPSSICLENYDTKQIRNLRDIDFGPESTKIPTSRPDEEVTRLLWFVVKDRQMESFAKVCRDALSHKEKSPAEVQALDHEIRQMHESIPDICKIRPMSQSIADDPFMIITRIYLDFISQKSLCVLHRRYMAGGNHFSTISCLNAGKAIVSEFLEMHQEFAPGGRLYTERWMLGCYTMNDFLLGITSLCLFLYCQWKSSDKHMFVKGDQVKEVVDLLKQAQVICLGKSSVSKDADRVARIVQLTLRRTGLIKGFSGGNQTVAPGADLLLPRWDAGDGITSMDSQLSDHVTGGNDPFGFFQQSSFAEDDMAGTDWAMFNGMTDMDWAIFDPSMSMQGI